MSTALILLFVLVLLLVVTVQPVRARVKALAVAASVFTWLGVLGLHQTLPGAPKSVLVETADVAEAEVLWANVQEDRIYLLLAWPGLQEPRYYWMAKTQERARQLQQGQAEARAMRRRLMVRQPFSAFRPGGNDGNTARRGNPSEPRGTGQQTHDNNRDEAVFYAPPPPPLPTKE